MVNVLHVVVSASMLASGGDEHSIKVGRGVLEGKGTRHCWRAVGALPHACSKILNSS
jgi:hypothetical protein